MVTADEIRARVEAADKDRIQARADAAARSPRTSNAAPGARGTGRDRRGHYSRPGRRGEQNSTRDPAKCSLPSMELSLLAAVRLETMFTRR